MTDAAEQLWDQLISDAHGLVPCVVQDLRTRAVLMVAWVSKAALARTLETGYAVYYSRARQTLWEKGAVSGNRQRIMHVRLDNDKDTLLYLVDAKLPAGNDGSDTYFNYRRQGGAWRWDPIKLSTDDGEARGDDRDPAANDTQPVDADSPDPIAEIRRQAARLAASEAPERTLQVATDLVETLVRTLKTKGLSLRSVLLNLERRMKS